MRHENTSIISEPFRAGKDIREHLFQHSHFRDVEIAASSD